MAPLLLELTDGLGSGRGMSDLGLVSSFASLLGLNWGCWNTSRCRIISLDDEGAAWVPELKLDTEVESLVEPVKLLWWPTPPFSEKLSDNLFDTEESAVVL